MNRIVTALVAVTLAACGADSADSSLTKAQAEAQAGKTDVGVDLCAKYGWYGDDECDTFCTKPDPDCGGAPANDGARWLSSCDIGDWVDLEALTVASQATLTPGDTLDGMTQQQIVLGFDVASVSDAFDYTDDKEIERWAFDGDEALVLYRYYAGDTEVGFFVAADGVELLGELNDGWFDASCTSSLNDPGVEPTNAPWSLDCSWGDEIISLAELAISGPTSLTVDTVTPTQAAHITQGMRDWADDDTLQSAFDATDDAEFVTREMTSAEPAASYAIYTYYAGDTQVAFIVDLASGDEVAVVNDGELGSDCSLVFRP